MIDVSICTLNLLSPCYKRVTSEADRESESIDQWKSRHGQLIDLLLSLDVDLICLQEFWFDAQGEFLRLYESRLSQIYSFHLLRRTCGLEDGVAILVRRTTWIVTKQVDLLLHDVGNRVALLLHLQSKIDRRTTLDLVNVHLTFPHHAADRQLRLKQIQRFLQLIDEHCSSAVIFAGDFNSPQSNDPIYECVTKTFDSSFRRVHGREVQVTHLTHRNEEVPTDFIFFRSNQLRPIESELIPRGCDEEKWSDWLLSDHRAVLTRFQLTGFDQ